MNQNKKKVVIGKKPSEIANNREEVQVQLKLDGFLIPKENPHPPQKFVPIDVTRDPKPKVLKRRGRPPKDKITKKLKTEHQEKPKPEDQEEVDDISLEEDEKDQIDQEDSNANKVKPRGSYMKPNFRDKLECLTQLVEFLQSKPTEKNGKEKSFNTFCEEFASAKEFKVSTVRSWCFSYKKNPSLIKELQILCSSNKKARQTGQIIKRQTTLTYSKELDQELVDWLHCALDKGMLISRNILKSKAKQIIKSEKEDFKASDAWVDCFLRRHCLSLRSLTDKADFQVDNLRELKEKFVYVMKNIIQKKKIEKRFIINFDETPFYWEHIPKKVVTRKMTKTCKGFKKGYQHSRSTVGLTVTANGEVLRPMLILRRKQPYILKIDNKINLFMCNSPDGWANEEIIIKWLDSVLLPYVKNNECLLLWDTYEAHKSKKIIEWLKKHQNINVGMIIGGTTDSAQPLDLGINRIFKSACKAKALSYTNTLLEALHETNLTDQNKQSEKLQIGNYFL